MFTLKRRPLPYHWVRHIKTPEWLDPVLGRNACLHFPLKLSCFRGSQTYGSASETLHSLFSHWRSRDYGAGSQRGMYDRERAIVRRKNYATCFMQKNEKPSSAYNNPKLLNKLVIQKKKQILYKRPIGKKKKTAQIWSVNTSWSSAIPALITHDFVPVRRPESLHFVLCAFYEVVQHSFFQTKQTNYTAMSTKQPLRLHLVVRIKNNYEDEN